jgi:TRAP-type mannitol/chloroaromatic compound transport system substrate-binding protein
MKRRDLVRAAGLAAVAVAPVAGKAQGDAGAPHQWNMVTAWPKHFPGPGVAAERLAQRIQAMSDGRLAIAVHGAGEVVPPKGVFDAVADGSAEMGHAASHYWMEKIPAAAFFSGVPFGMTAVEMNAWFYYGGGLELWRELYAPYAVMPFPAGNAGIQMGGWFRKPLQEPADFKGLRMRIAGLGGQVLASLGAAPVAMPVKDVVNALQTGKLDAAEFVGPRIDMAMGLYKAAKYYYLPGWHEPCSPVECIVNRKAWQRLPEDLQAIVASACQAINNDMFAEMTAENARALEALTDRHGVIVSRFPGAVIETLHGRASAVLADYATRDASTRKVYDAFVSFTRQVRGWTAVSDGAYLPAREDNKISFASGSLPASL